MLKDKQKTALPSISAVPQFLKKSNIYEVNIRQYTPEGTFKAFTKHLPRLKDMGVEILWLMPIYPIGIKNRKGILGSYYSIQDHTGINPEFGTTEDFIYLVNEIHELGMKIILDWVANHCSWDCEWGKTNPEFFLRDQQGNFLPPYDWTDVIQIDHNNDDEQQAMINAMKYWVMEFDVDGFRADLAHLTPLKFWKNARSQTDILKTDLIWLAETEELSFFEAFDIIFTWRWMHKTEDYLKNDLPIAELRNLLDIYKTQAPINKLWMFFTSNHDENSWNGTEYEKYGPYAKAFAVLSCTYNNSIPLIYSGQELPNLKRLKFFEKDDIVWAETLALHGFYKTLLSFRKQNSIFENSEETETGIISTENKILAFHRKNKNETLLVILNLGKEKTVTEINMASFSGNYKNIFTGEAFSITENLKVELLPGDFLVLEKQNIRKD